VRGEARSGVEGLVRRDRSEALRIQRQDLLQALDCVCNQQRDGAENQQLERVGFPVLALPRVDAAEPVEQPFDRPEKARQRLPVAFEDAEHVDAERLCDRQDKRREKQNLKPAVERHKKSLRTARATKAPRADSLKSQTTR